MSGALSNTVTIFSLILLELHWHAEHISKDVFCFFPASSSSKGSSTWLSFLFSQLAFLSQIHSPIPLYSLHPSALSPASLPTSFSGEPLTLISLLHSIHHFCLSDQSKPLETNRQKYYLGTQPSTSFQTLQIASMGIWGQEQGRNKDLSWDCCALGAPPSMSVPGFMLRVTWGWCTSQTWRVLRCLPYPVLHEDNS